MVDTRCKIKVTYLSILRKVSKGAKIRNRYNQVQGDCTHKEVQEVLFSMKKKPLRFLSPDAPSEHPNKSYVGEITSPQANGTTCSRLAIVQTVDFFSKSAHHT